MRIKLENQIILLSVCEDVIDLCFFQSIIQEYFQLNDKNIVREKSLEILQFFLENKLINIGELTDLGIKPFKGSPIQIIKKLRIDWEGLKNEINIGDIAWIGLSKYGKDKLFMLLKDFFKKEFLSKKKN